MKNVYKLLCIQCNDLKERLFIVEDSKLFKHD